VVRDAITGRSVTRPATSEEARQAAYRVEHPLRHPASGPARQGRWVGAPPVSCGCGFVPRTAGGTLSLAGMGCGGCEPRICVGPDLVLEGLVVLRGS
jgi:hypothetical protein